MNCHVCGEKLEKVTTDLPFKLGSVSIMIIRKLPVFQCVNCREFLIEDCVMKVVDRILSQAKEGAELEVFSYS